jgi:hypothetical protein
MTRDLARQITKMMMATTAGSVGYAMLVGLTGSGMHPGDFSTGVLWSLTGILWAVWCWRKFA